MAIRQKLAFVGQPEYNNVFYETDLDDLYEVRCFPLHFHGHGEVQPASVQGLFDFAPDITVIFRAEFLAPEILERLRGLRIAISTEPFPKLIDGRFHYTRDSISRFRLYLKLAERDLDYIFHYDEASLSFMALMGAWPSGPFVLPVATGVWCPRAGAPVDWDAVFLGRSTEHRERHLGLLKRDFRTLHIVHGIMGRDTVPYYQTAHIGLNLHSEPELSWEPRVQQMMACGVLVVTEPISPNDLLRPGEHFLETTSSHQTYEICRDVVADPRRFEEIRRAGYERVLHRFSAGQEWPRLFERCHSGDLPRPRFDSARVRLAPFEIAAEYNGFDHLLDMFLTEHA